MKLLNGAQAAGSPVLTASQTGSNWGNGWTPGDYGFLTWSFDPANCDDSGTAPQAGSIYLIKVILRAAATVTDIVMLTGTAGSSLTSGQCLAGLYSTTGTQLRVTGSQHTNWAASPGTQTMALTSSYSAAAGSYYVAIVANGTTMPTFSCGSRYGGTTTSNPTAGNAGLSAGSYRFCHSSTGNTSLPSSITVSSCTPDANSIWAALS